jgi:GTP-binding nuclear protein Ran
MTKDTRTFKVLLVGNSGVGKTAFLHRYLKKRFEHSLPVTANVEKYDILLHTTVGPVRYEIWDVSGSQKPNTLASSEFDEIDAAIIMFDLTDRISYNNVPNWYRMYITFRIEATLTGSYRKPRKQGRDAPREVYSHLYLWEQE